MAKRQGESSFISDGGQIVYLSSLDSSEYSTRTYDSHPHGYDGGSSSYDSGSSSSDCGGGGGE